MNTCEILRIALGLSMVIMVIVFVVGFTLSLYWDYKGRK
jgi:hypothetical protein